MKSTFKIAIKYSIFILFSFLIGWVSYWAGFSKALQIGLYVNQQHDQSQALEYDRLIAQLDSKKIEEVRTHLKDLSSLLKEQAGLQGVETNSILDLLVPTDGLSLVRDYDRHRAKASDNLVKPSNN